MKIISIKSLNIKDKNLIWSFAVILLGIIFGIFLYICSKTFLDVKLNDLFINFSENIAINNFLEKLHIIILGNIILFLCLIICGGSLFGRWLCPLLIIFKVSGISIIICHLYSTYGLTGLEYVLLVFFPGKILLIYALLFMCKSSISMSEKIRQTANNNYTREIKTYYLKCIYTLLLVLLSSLTDCICINLFSGILSI